MQSFISTPSHFACTMARSTLPVCLLPARWYIVHQALNRILSCWLHHCHKEQMLRSTQSVVKLDNVFFFIGANLTEPVRRDVVQASCAVKGP